MLTNTMIERRENEVDMLDRYFTVLEQVIENQPIGIVNLFNELGSLRHKVRYSFRILEAEGIIKPTAQERSRLIKWRISSTNTWNGSMVLSISMKSSLNPEIRLDGGQREGDAAEIVETLILAGTSIPNEEP